MLYTVTATNKQGIDGVVKLSNGKEVPTSHPLNDLPGFNPEELMALAWSTCLSATIQVLLETKGLSDKQSKVAVTANLQKEEDAAGYYFELLAEAAIEDLPLAQAEELVAQAHSRCPVSKLMVQAQTIKLSTVAWQGSKQYSHLK